MPLMLPYVFALIDAIYVCCFYLPRARHAAMRCAAAIDAIVADARLSALLMFFFMP